MILTFTFKAAESVELDVVRKWVKNNFVTFEVRLTVLVDSLKSN